MTPQNNQYKTISFKRKSFLKRTQILWVKNS